MATFPYFGVDLVQNFVRCLSAHFKLLYLFQLLIYMRQGSPHWWT